MMALTLEIEYLGGVCYAAKGPESNVPDWPPQPDRVFSALVATWGAHGEPSDERCALEWLEKLTSHGMWSMSEPRSGPIVFVPPNDPRTDRAKHAAGTIPMLRSRQPRRFPASRPYDPVVRYFWREKPNEKTFVSLERLARDTAYVGHSASLTRCRFFLNNVPENAAVRTARRRVYPGRLKELSEAWGRFQKSADKKDRPNFGVPVLKERASIRMRHNVFSDRWLILECADGVMPDIRAAAIVTRGIRRALMSGYGQLGKSIPTCISGHETDGSPACAPHLAVVPLAFTGFPYADGRMLGFALIPPSEDALFEDEDFRKVLRKLAPLDDHYGRRILEAKSPEGAAPDQAFALKLSPTFEAPPDRRSLDPRLYTRSGRQFATVTPIALDRYLKKRGEVRLEEIVTQIRSACARIGLPEPTAVYPDKHSALEGAPSAYPSGKSPRWMTWRLPGSLAQRQLTHAVIHFSEAVDGPLLLGAGRFLGLGLCRPLDQGK
jgi:CRISPR-associated protein Csb2